MIGNPDLALESRASPTLVTRGASTSLTVYYRITARFLNIEMHLPAGEERDHSAVTRFVHDQCRDRPSFYIVWTADHLNLLALPFASKPLRVFSRQFHFFADDSPGGFVMQRILAKLNANCLPLSEIDQVARLKLLRRVIERRPSAFLVVDGRGPYFEIGTGLVNLARATRSAVIPCAVVASRSVWIPNKRLKIGLPAPGSKVVLGFGSAIVPSTTSATPHILAEELKTAMTDLHNHMSALCRRLEPPIAP